MHYANGQEAKAGDLVTRPANPGWGQDEVVGILISAKAGSETCNGQMQVLARRGTSDAGVTTWMPFLSAGDWCMTVGELLPLVPAEIPKPEAAKS